ncbi:DUF4232 domain-containing protein [Streptomyces pinistramenti]|uniref:DUF4232 domain-containing protein n=1 Tax=Streptomyces pinistramenti TaxID=2884812 RepID=UPI001D078550|nr:DUF4232 domain-containing protein [Streptomyces pinistramenti]MCB5911372.1 DUF4232 domain-containing protein [Streptomyces pinistramenti]
MRPTVMRITRSATRVLASAAVLTAALSLTACQNDTKDTGSQAPAASTQPSAGGQDGAAGPGKDGGAKESDTHAQGARATNASASGASGTSGSKSTGRSGTQQHGSGGGADSGPVTTACTGANVKVTVTKVDRPINHLLLTATNTGSKPCNAYSAPYLRWDEGQAATTILEESKPQAVRTLKPGESAYAGIMTESADGSGNSGYTAHKLAVFFADRAGQGSTGPAANPTLPKGGIYTDSSAWVTYWQTTAADALTW